MIGTFPDWVWVVIWPANTSEPIWIFQSEEDALVFTEGIPDHVHTQPEPVLSTRQVRELVAMAAENS